MSTATAPPTSQPDHPEHPSDPPVLELAVSTGRLGYTDEGAGDVTLVGIPGLPGTVRDFRWLAPALTDHVRLVRLELPGFGRSTRRVQVGMDLAARARIVAEAITALELGPVVTLGHSAGCLVSAQLARHRPELVRAAVFMASPGVRAHYPVRAYQRASLLLRHPRLARAMAPLLRTVYRRAGFPSYLTDDERRFTTLDAAVQDFEQHAANIAAMRCPTLVAWAADDRLIPDAYATELADLAPAGPRLRFEKGGHNIQKTRANRIAEAIRSFTA